MEKRAARVVAPCNPLRRLRTSPFGYRLCRTGWSASSHWPGQARRSVGSEVVVDVLESRVVGIAYGRSAEFSPLVAAVCLGKWLWVWFRFPPQHSPKSQPVEVGSFFLGGMYARSVDIKKHHEVMAQLLLRLSRCASSKKSNPDLQWSLVRLSFYFSTQAQNTPTGEGVNTSRILSLSFFLNAVGLPFRLLSLHFPCLVSPPLFFLNGRAAASCLSVCLFSLAWRRGCLARWGAGLKRRLGLIPASLRQIAPLLNQPPQIAVDLDFSVELRFLAHF